MDLIHNLHAECVEYPTIYDLGYGSIYDQELFFYEDENFDDEAGLDYNYDYDQDEDSGTDDLILEEIPFVYCPSKGEFIEA